jgi:hypothetical protein
MRHELLRRKAEFIGEFVDFHKRGHKLSRFPHKAVGELIELLFLDSFYVGRGAHKTVHRVRSRARDLVLKTAPRQEIRSGERAYNAIPANRKNRYFAKVYWRTKYCLPQKYGKDARVPAEKLAHLKKIGKEFGLSDIRPANVRKVDGHFKIVDASLRKKKR